MPLSRDEFTQHLVASGLLDEAAIAEALSSLPADQQPRDGEQLARELVKQKQLTKFQAEQLYAGKGKSLTLGNYVILDKLGQGGMGMVLKAQHKRMKRLVALKVMSPAAVKSADALKRFHREVEAAAKLTHPNIVAAFDADEAKGTHFLVMEYVEGTDLSALVKKRGPMPIDQAIECTIQAARGLEFAHEQGVIHRDIKPANLLIDTKGTVKILDLGLARIDGVIGGSSEGAGLTQTGTIMGTVDYMSPEQAMDTKHADARSDIYSLGCTLYYLLTGKVVYDGDTMMKKLMAHQHTSVPSLSSLAAPPQEGRASVDSQTLIPSSEVSDPSAVVSRRDTATLQALDVVFQRMVAKRPDDRQQSMATVIVELQQCLPSGFLSEVGSPTFTYANVPSGTGMELRPTRPASGTGVAEDSSGTETTKSSSGSFQTDSPTTSSKMVARGSREVLPVTQGTQVPLRRWIVVGVLVVVTVAGGFVVLYRGGGTRDAATDLRGEVASISDTKFTTTPKKATSWQGWPGDSPKPAIAPFSEEQARQHQLEWAKYLGVPVDYTNSIGMKFVLIPPGEFIMGSPSAEIESLLRVIIDRNWQEFIKSEAPQHKVILTQPTYLGVHEVTQADYQKVVGRNPSFFSATGSDKTLADRVAATDTSRHPVEGINWSDAVEFCAKLTQMENSLPVSTSASEKGTASDVTAYHLPSEAEWEYACRAGTMTKFWNGDRDDDLKQVAWYGNDLGRTHAVGELAPNPFGLYDTHGNVWEWVQDAWDPTYFSGFQGQPAVDPKGVDSGGYQRVMRGGYYLLLPIHCRASTRCPNDMTIRFHHSGVRVALKVDAVKAAIAAKLQANSKKAIDRPTVAPSPAVAPFNATQARAHQEKWARHLGTQVETTNSIGQKMILIPPGEFLMGSTDAQVAAALTVANEINATQGTKDRVQKAERPQHKVVISKPFLMSASEVTIGQFKKFSATGYVTEAEKAAQSDPKVTTYLNPGYEITDDSPAASITWNDAVAYCKWRSDQEEKTYRLPTEAEWEYACRAGTTTQYPFGDDFNELAKYGWHDKNAGGRSHPIATLLPNNFGLFDMHGNLFEWCGDWYHDHWYEQTSTNDPSGPTTGTMRVLRGGRWGTCAVDCRSAFRQYQLPSSRYNGNGFRCVAELDQGARNLTWVEVLASVDPIADRMLHSRNVGGNQWERRNGLLTYVSDGKPGKLRLPVELNGRDVEIEAVFTPLQEPAGISIDFPTPEHKAIFQLGSGRRNQASFSLRHFQGQVAMTRGQPLDVKLRFTSEKKGNAVAHMTVNGKTVLDWTGPLSEAAVNPDPVDVLDTRSIALWVDGCSWEFKSFRVRVHDGNVRLLRQP